MLLIQTDQRIGIELPLRILIRQHGEEAPLGYREQRVLSRRA